MNDAVNEAVNPDCVFG